MSYFWAGLIVGIVAASVCLILALGICQSAAWADREIERMRQPHKDGPR